MGHFCSKIDFLCILFVLIFMLIFGIAFGRPPASILKIWGSFQGAFWGHFVYFFADAAKLKKCNPLERNACFATCWASDFALILLIFCMCFLCCFLDGLFAQFLWILASKEGPFWSIFSHIFQILHEKNILKLRHANEAFVCLIWRGRRRGAGPV